MEKRCKWSSPTRTQVCESQHIRMSIRHQPTSLNRETSVVEFTFEASGGAKFTRGYAGCDQKRFANGDGTLVMPGPGSGDVTVWSGFAYSKTTVEITPAIVLKGTPPCAEVFGAVS
jgi:hypothetical protein